MKCGITVRRELHYILKLSNLTEFMYDHVTTTKATDLVPTVVIITTSMFMSVLMLVVLPLTVSEGWWMLGCVSILSGLMPLGRILKASACEQGRVMSVMVSLQECAPLSLGPGLGCKVTLISQSSTQEVAYGELLAPRRLSWKHFLRNGGVRLFCGCLPEFTSLVGGMSSCISRALEIGIKGLVA
eukprot:5419013-Amphidinium_carterae.1